MRNHVRVRIREEELYRAEIRRQLSDESTKERRQSKALVFLNSSFGLWLLSAVFVTGVGSLYSQWRTSHADQVKKEEEARVETVKLNALRERLDAEIAHRISKTILLLYSVADHGNEEKLAAGHTTSEVAAILEDFVNGSGSRVGAMYSEFANLSTLALMSELRSNIPKEQIAPIDSASQDLSGLVVLLEVTGAPLSNPKRVAGVILDKFASNPRWRDRAYFLDCSKDYPFC